MSETSLIIEGDEIGRSPSPPVSWQVRVPASTSNLGAGFDCFGLALNLYLTVRASVLPAEEATDFASAARWTIATVGEGGEAGGALAPESQKVEDNLICRAIARAAAWANRPLPPRVRLEVRNEIPLGRGLGSSAAAIVAGLSLCGKLTGGEDLPIDAVLRLATEMEGHPDNVAASVLGGWVTACVREDGAVLALGRKWPADIKLLVVSPHVALPTKQARAALPHQIDRKDAVHNIQRAALFGAALEARADDMIWEAMQDRLHQPHRQAMVPGLAHALATPRAPGLLGLALSGAGPSVIALARGGGEAEIGARLVETFAAHGVEATARVLEADCDGRVLKND